MKHNQITRNIHEKGDVLQPYLNEIYKIKLVDKDEEIRLGRIIRESKDPKTIERLLKSNLRFAFSIAKQYQHQGLPLSDLIGEGNLGLTKAIKKFDERKGFKFISYAVWWIRQSIILGISESRLIHFPLNRVGEINKINKKIEYLQQNLFREPSLEEIGLCLDLTESEVNDLLTENKKLLSFDAPLSNSDDEDSCLLDIIPGEKIPEIEINFRNDSLKIEISLLLAKIPKKEAEIISLFYGLNIERALTEAELAEKYNIKQQYVSKIRQRGMGRLKQIVLGNNNHLLEYLD